MKTIKYVLPVLFAVFSCFSAQAGDVSAKNDKMLQSGVLSGLGLSLMASGDAFHSVVPYIGAVGVLYGAKSLVDTLKSAESHENCVGHVAGFSIGTIGAMTCYILYQQYQKISCVESLNALLG